MAKKKVGKKGKADDQDDSKFSSERISPASEAANDNPETTEEPEKSVFELLGEDDEDGGLMNMISRSVKKKGKKAKPSKADFSGSDNDDKFGIGALAALGSDEEEDVFGQIVSKKKNKKDKKGAISFDSLGDLDISDPEIALPSKKNKKKKSKKELPAFDALDEEDILDAVEETQELDSAPKSKGKKSKKSKDLPAFDEPFDVEQDEVEKEVTPPTTKKGKKNKKDDELDALAALIEDDSVPAPAASNVKPKKGKKKKTDDDLDALAALIEDSTVAPTPAPKNKKGKNKKKADDFDDAFALENQDEDPTASKDAHLTPEAEPEIKIKSAKQKEKERKERQKEEKKRQASLQKAQEESSADLSQAPTQKAETETAKGKGKKGKGPSAAILALRKQQEALRAAEEEAARLMEEEKKRIEEEERREAEEEAKKEQARQEKKQRELEKREQLRKEGKLLTKAQKEAKRKQELRLQSLVASGMKIAAFEEKAEVTEGEKPKRIIYNDRKKRGKGPNANNSTSPATPPPASIPEPKPEPEEVKAPQIKEVKDSWDDSEDDVKDNWEDSDDQESADKDDEAAATKEKDNVSVPTQGEDKASDQESSEGSDDSDDSDGSYDSDESDSEEELTPAQRQLLLKKQEAAERRKQRIDAAMAARSKDDLRSPICCILGHVDTGKTKLLDKIRQTNVQEGEAGGITQQIGATYFPVENIIQKTAILGNNPDEYNLPGLLVIDTPGHESFTNLRTRGSSLCNIAILVVDLMHGLEPQTLESIRLLRDRKTPFIVALNKIDRIYDWNPTPDNGFLDSFSKQKKYVQDEFDTRVAATITAFAEQGLNAKLYYENKNFAKYVSFVPTSAITGEGIPDLLHLLVTLTQSRLTDRLMYVSELECTVLEVKVIEGLGTTIDVVLSNGYLNEGDRIVVCGLNGPIVTQVRALLTPQPLRELRIKSAYVHHKRVKAALGIKISAPDLEKAIAGSRLLVLGPDDDEDELKDAVMEDLQTLLSSIDKSGRGVSVQASTLGSLEALLEFLRVSKIPVSAINIGPVHKKDIIRASAMLEKAKEFAVMLAFDVEVDKDASQLADQLGVRVFTADIIYHLFDQFTAFNKEVVEQRRKEQAPSAVFPCVLKMIPGAIFSRRDPIILGADVVEGALRIGTPICVVQFDAATKKREVINLGVVTGIENNHKPVEIVKKGMAGAGVAVKIECPPSDTPKLFGRHFTEKDALYSCITRRSINVLKESFRDDLSKDEWALVVKLKKILDVV